MYFCLKTSDNNLFPMAPTALSPIKPDQRRRQHCKIIDRIIGAGFTIKAMKWTQLSMDDAAAFYAVHKERPFFGNSPST